VPGSTPGGPTYLKFILKTFIKVKKLYRI